MSRIDQPADDDPDDWLDDHSRYALSVTAHQPVTGPAVVTTFRTAIAEHGIPWWTVTATATAPASPPETRSPKCRRSGP